MRFFTILALLMAFVLCGAVPGTTAAPVADSVPNVILSASTFTVVATIENVFTTYGCEGGTQTSHQPPKITKYDVVAVRDSTGEVFVILSQAFTDTAKLAAKRAIPLRVDQQYELILIQSSFTPNCTPKPDERTFGNNTTIGVSLHDDANKCVEQIVWKDGEFTQQLYTATQIWGSYYIPPRKE